MSRARNPYRHGSWWHTGQPARVVADQPEAVVEDPPEPYEPQADQLRHGYTLADLHAVARLAVHTVGTMATDWHERYDTAWSAIAEALYAANEAPPRYELVRAGQLAIYAVVDDHRQHHGYYKRKTIGDQAGPGSSPAFVTYWQPLTRPTPSPERAIVERLSLSAILHTLTPRQRQAIHALAVHDDYTRAAAALGMKRKTFDGYIAGGRRRFLALWHQGEAPSRVWGCDRRAGVTAADRRTGGTTIEAIRRRRRSRMKSASARTDGGMS